MKILVNPIFALLMLFITTTDSFAEQFVLDSFSVHFSDTTDSVRSFDANDYQGLILSSEYYDEFLDKVRTVYTGANVIRKDSYFGEHSVALISFPSISTVKVDTLHNVEKIEISYKSGNIEERELLTLDNNSRDIMLFGSLSVFIQSINLETGNLDEKLALQWWREGLKPSHLEHVSSSSRASPENPILFSALCGVRYCDELDFPVFDIELVDDERLYFDGALRSSGCGLRNCDSANTLDSSD